MRITVIEEVEDLFDIVVLEDREFSLASENAVSDFPLESARQAVLERDGHRCAVCGSPRNLHVHHIVPRAAGGRHKSENLVTLCCSCHGAVEAGDVYKAVFSCVKRAIANRPR